MKTKVTLLIAAVAFFGMGCASTVTLGPDANADSYLGASANTKGASLTLPLVKGELKTTGKTETKTKKK